MQNVETLAHLALIARYGPRWFRAIGTSDEPGSMLTTVYRPDARAHIREAAIGTPLSALLGTGEGASDGDHAGIQAWLVGGYHGTWLPMPGAAGITLDNASLGRFGAAAGAGVPLDFRPEHGQRAADVADRAVRVVAGTAAFDQA